jgi:hypothetical protein
MALETAIFYVVALAVPVWLLVEEVVHRERRQAPRPARSAALSRRPLRPSRAA